MGVYGINKLQNDIAGLCGEHNTGDNLDIRVVPDVILMY